MNINMRLIAFIIALFFATTVFAQQTNSTGSEIFSKQDATAMFEFSLKEWKTNVMQAKQAGAAEFDTDGDLFYTMFFHTPDGKVVITPSYASDNTTRPWKLSVAIVFNDLQAVPMQMMKDDEIKKAFVEDVYYEMLPEFTVFSNIEMPNVTSFIHSVQIFESGFDEIIDEQASKQLGCFQTCVSRGY